MTLSSCRHSVEIFCTSIPSISLGISLLLCSSQHRLSCTEQEELNQDVPAVSYCCILPGSGFVRSLNLKTFVNIHVQTFFQHCVQKQLHVPCLWVFQNTNYANAVMASLRPSKYLTLYRSRSTLFWTVFSLAWLLSSKVEMRVWASFRFPHGAISFSFFLFPRVVCLVLGMLHILLSIMLVLGYFTSLWYF